MDHPGSIEGSVLKALEQVPAVFALMAAVFLFLKHLRVSEDARNELEKERLAALDKLANNLQRNNEVMGRFGAQLDVFGDYLEQLRPKGRQSNQGGK